MTSISTSEHTVLEDTTDLHSIGRRLRRHPLRMTLLADAVAGLLAMGVVSLFEPTMPVEATLLLILTWLALMASARAYEPMPTGFSEMRLRSVLHAGVGLGLICWVVSSATPGRTTPGQLLLLTVATTGLALSHRFGTRALRIALRSPVRPTPVLVAGEPDDVRRMLVELRRGNSRQWNVVGVCLTQGSADDIDTIVHVGVQDLYQAVSECHADAAIVVPCPALDPATLRRLSWQLERTGIHLLLGTGMLDVATSRATLVRGGDLGMVHVRARPDTGPSLVVKTVTERLAAAFALLVLAPVLLAIAVAVRLDSSGGSIFRQTRVGARGREFTMYKYRTMSDGADLAVDELAGDNESDGILFKIKADPRITRIGRLLRRYSLDELPQLVNVVRGDMALVGPRPALPSEVAQYDADSRRRLAVRPGLTGLWQVSGRSDLTWEDTVRLDLHYVDNWSFLLDAGIVLRTAGAVLGHRGAY